MRPLLISGPTGSGKSTLARRLAAESLSMYSQVTTTTSRALRSGEVATQQEDGSLRGNYIYRDKVAFREGVSRGDYLEYVEVGGELYGLELRELESVIASGRAPIVIQTPDGALKTRDKLLEAGHLVDTVYIHCDQTWSTQVCLNRYRADLQSLQASVEPSSPEFEREKDRLLTHVARRITSIARFEPEWQNYAREFDHQVYNGPELDFAVLLSAVRSAVSHDTRIEPAPDRLGRVARPGGR